MTAAPAHGMMTRQFVRYVLVGVGTNGAGYLAYLLLTWAGLEYKLTMTILYALGIGLSFALNRKWSFGEYRQKRGALPRFLIAYGGGWVFNYAMLAVLADHYRFPHQIVQAITICILVVAFFLLQRYWIFRPEKEPTRDSDATDRRSPHE